MVNFAFLDSGTGGLPYMLHLKKVCPEAHCVYVGDTHNFPYGEKTPEQIIDCASGTVERIIRAFNPENIVIACNTISVTALVALRSRFAVRFVGTVPAIKLAASLSKNRRIGLLATKRTVSEPYTENLISDFAADCQVVKRGDSDLVDYIEHNLFTATNEQKLQACKPAVDFFLSHDVDIIVLACTHFIHFASEIAQLAGNAVQVVDSREGVVKQALRTPFFSVCDSTTNSQTPPDQSLFVTDLNPSYMEEYRKTCAFLGIPFGGLLL